MMLLYARRVELQHKEAEAVSLRHPGYPESLLLLLLLLFMLFIVMIVIVIVSYCYCYCLFPNMSRAGLSKKNVVTDV